MALGLRYIVLLLPMAVSEIWGLTKRERGRTVRRTLSSALRPQYDQKYLNQKLKNPAEDFEILPTPTFHRTFVLLLKLIKILVLENLVQILDLFGKVQLF